MTRVVASRQDGAEFTSTADHKAFVAGATAFRATKGCLECHDDAKVGEPVGYMVLERWAVTEAAALRASQIKSALMSVAVVVLLGIALSLIARTVTKPLGRITVAAARIADGDIDQTVTVESNDELGTLAASFRDMMRGRSTGAVTNAASRGRSANSCRE